MNKELYIDISNEDAGGSLYKMTDTDGKSYFYYNHSTYNSDTDELKVFETNYPNFTCTRFISIPHSGHLLNRNCRVWTGPFRAIKNGRRATSGNGKKC